MFEACFKVCLIMSARSEINFSCSILIMASPDDMRAASLMFISVAYHLTLPLKIFTKSLAINLIACTA